MGLDLRDVEGWEEGWMASSTSILAIRHFHPCMIRLKNTVILVIVVFKFVNHLVMMCFNSNILMRCFVTSIVQAAVRFS